MTEVRKAGELFSFNHDPLVTAGVKAVPVPLKFATRGLELRPSLFPVERVDFFFVGAGVVIDDHIREGLHFVLMDYANQVLKFGAVTVESLDRALLIKIAEIEIVVRIVAV